MKEIEFTAEEYKFSRANVYRQNGRRRLSVFLEDKAGGRIEIWADIKWIDLIFFHKPPLKYGTSLEVYPGAKLGFLRRLFGISRRQPEQIIKKLQEKLEAIKGISQIQAEIGGPPEKRRQQP